MPETQDQPQTRRQVRRARRGAGPGDRIIANFLQKDHPILREIFQTVAPILLGFLTSNLPMLLNNLTNALTDPEEKD